ncbi:hypothetical protein ACFOW9_04265 [Arthrobacter cryoconiti]|uniref:Uncharacterized protein n=2 Tax=Arthrobacter cryoconiti TaxID=748907 RepID=A0ABV8QX42_9MICC|nr:hypothetical protein [Arthrobacter cryoconiti]
MPLPPVGVGERLLAGHTRISTQALTAVAKAASAEIFSVAPSAVRVSWADDAGSLALSVSSPMSSPPLSTVRGNPERVQRSGGSVVTRATEAKARIQTRVQELTGSRLSRVDIRISGLQATERGRVA